MIPPYTILDTFPLANSAVEPAKPGAAPTLSQQCRQWFSDCEKTGTTILVPSVTYYEALREMERRGVTGQIKRLKAYIFNKPGRFLPITTQDLEAAAKMWGFIRNAGMPTASKDALDADIILAAQALGLGLPAADFLVATTNAGHLTRFVPAELRMNITS